MKIQINRTMYAEVENIDFLEVRKEKVYVHLKVGYPKILRARVGLDNFMLRLVNAGVNSEGIVRFKNSVKRS